MNKISDLIKEIGASSRVPLVNSGKLLASETKKKINIMALGDVGTTMAIGLKLLGGDVISEIGLYDLSADNCMRLEAELSQISYPFPDNAPPMPKAFAIKEEELFSCDILIFCASKSVPAIGAKGDMRMLQLEANSALVKGVAEKAKAAGYEGAIFIVSDPVDPLCHVAMRESGLKPEMVRGFGLGVMNARARYFAERDERFASYLTEGRAFGPHGADLVIANSINDYDDALSKELTELAVSANMKIRDLGFKPYIAPSLSSAAISIILTLRGEWNYGSVYLGDSEKGAYFGVKSRITEGGTDFEDIEVPDRLYERLKKAYIGLYELTK